MKIKRKQKIITNLFWPFSPQGNMKQHMLTHKIRDMFGNSNSGDDSSVGGGHTSDSQSTNNNNQQINFAIKLEKTKSTDFNDEKYDDNDGDSDNKANIDSENRYLNKQYDQNEINWCNKLNEIPENIAAS